MFLSGKRCVRRLDVPAHKQDDDKKKLRANIVMHLY